MDTDKSVVTAGVRGVMGVERGLVAIHGDGIKEQ